MPSVRTAMTDRVYDLLRAQIIDIELIPGARLHIESLSEQFDVSPTPIREALNRLAAERIVTQEPYRGFRVSDLLSGAELTQLLRVRELIESAAVEQTARTRTDDVLQKLNVLVERMDAIVFADEFDIKAFNAADAEFHRLTVSASGNRFLLEALEALHVHVQIARLYHSRSSTESRRSNKDHKRLLESIERGDSEDACNQVRIHIGHVLSHFELSISDGQIEAVA